MVDFGVGLVNVYLEGIFGNIFGIKSDVDGVCINSCRVVDYWIGVIFVVSDVCGNFFIVIVNYFYIDVIIFGIFCENCEFSFYICVNK